MGLTMYEIHKQIIIAGKSDFHRFVINIYDFYDVYNWCTQCMGVVDIDWYLKTNTSTTNMSSKDAITFNVYIRGDKNAALFKLTWM